MCTIIADIKFLDHLQLLTLSKTEDGTWTPLDYDPSNDLVSYIIRREGWWEPDQTELFLEMLNKFKDADPIFIDIGSHIGYYSFIASHKYNTNCIAFDISPYYSGVFKQTLNSLNINNIIHHMTQFDITKIPKNRKLIVKIDIEGAELGPVKQLDDRFTNKDVVAAFIEVTPEKHEIQDYIDKINNIRLLGYDVYNIGNSSPRSYLTCENDDDITNCSRLNTLTSLNENDLDTLINDLVINKTQTNLLCIVNN